MSGLDMQSNERGCADRWEREHAFEAETAVKDKYYLTVAYPYPSGAMHVGHGRTYIVPDVIARYQRMKGKQVLFPMAFHVTGTPVIALCGKVWVPSRDPERFPVCPECKDIWESLDGDEGDLSGDA